MDISLKTKVNTKALSGKALDWAIGDIEGTNKEQEPLISFSTDTRLTEFLKIKYDIEVHKEGFGYFAIFDDYDIKGNTGETEAVAVCRSIVDKIRGDTTFIPNDLASSLL